MKNFIGTIVGEFTESQSVQAENIEQATKILSENGGETRERSATGNLEVSDVEEVE